MNFLYGRWTQFLAFFFCHELLMAAFYFQYVEFLDPCPLCILQRIAVLGLGIVFLINGIHLPKFSSWPQKIYDGLLALFALFGLSVASWQVYLQQLPKDEVPECGPGLSYMLDTLPLFDVVKKMFTGSGECAEVSWTLWGISMPGWMIIVFACFVLFVGLRRFTHKPSRQF